jgi:hypothetical protein
MPPRKDQPEGEEQPKVNLLDTADSSMDEGSR